MNGNAWITMGIRTSCTHLLDNNILIDKQSGFRPKSSTMAAAYNLINEVMDALN
jgi:hypothetical protein